MIVWAGLTFISVTPGFALLMLERPGQQARGGNDPARRHIAGHGTCNGAYRETIDTSHGRNERPMQS
jgi:hypothetical protein